MKRILLLFICFFLGACQGKEIVHVDLQETRVEFEKVLLHSITRNTSSLNATIEKGNKR